MHYTNKVEPKFTFGLPRTVECYYSCATIEEQQTDEWIRATKSNRYKKKSDFLSIRFFRKSAGRDLLKFHGLSAMSIAHIKFHIPVTFHTIPNSSHIPWHPWNMTLHLVSNYLKSQIPFIFHDTTEIWTVHLISEIPWIPNSSHIVGDP